jgi:3-phenylpropionate/trans-cinnamate dioxygenase ferredoxin subunit
VNHSADGFVFAARLSDFPESGVLPLEVDDHYVVLVRLEGQVYCLEDVCTHDGGPLGEGELLGHCLVCPRHGAQFDVRSGDAVTMPATEPTTSYAVRLVGDEVLVKLSTEY